MIGCLRIRVRKQPIIALYFESETVLKFLNLEACIQRVTEGKFHFEKCVLDGCFALRHSFLVSVSRSTCMLYLETSFFSPCFPGRI